MNRQCRDQGSNMQREKYGLRTGQGNGVSDTHRIRMDKAQLTVMLPAEVDHHSAEELRQMMDLQLRKAMIRRIVFDFSDTVFMDSSGIGMIMGAYKNIRFMGGDVVAVHVNERMKKLLTMSGISKWIEIELQGQEKITTGRRESV